MVVAVGAIWDDAWSAAEDAADVVADAASSVVTTLHDAGNLIGGALKFASPLLAFYPGIGTALSVATYAAGAIAAGDRITDAALGIASSAMPPGLPRIGFDSGVAITRDVAAGRDAFGSVVDACRSAAQQVGGDRAVAAFDAALAAARGGRIDERAIAALRASVANGGTSAALAFDAGVGVARGESAPQVLLSVARSYITEAGGGPLALAAFDSGVALGYGQTLQEAGWGALQKFVRGTGAEKVLRFVEQLIAARRAGKDLETFLREALAGELRNVAGYGATALRSLGPIVDRLKVDPSLLEVASDSLGRAWGVAEPLIRAAQAIMAGGSENAALRDELVRPPYESTGAAVGPSVVQSARAAAPGVTLSTSALATGVHALAALPARAPVPIVSSAPPPRAPVPIVQTQAPATARAGVAGDVAIGATIGAAGLALWYWWAHG